VVSSREIVLFEFEMQTRQKNLKTDFLVGKRFLVKIQENRFLEFKLANRLVSSKTGGFQAVYHCPFSVKTVFSLKMV
jgi:hypothetical protein